MSDPLNTPDREPPKRQVRVVVVVVLFAIIPLIIVWQISKRGNQPIWRDLVIESLGSKLPRALSVTEVTDQTSLVAVVKFNSTGVWVKGVGPKREVHYALITATKPDGSETGIFEQDPDSNLIAFLSTFKVGQQYDFATSIRDWKRGVTSSSGRLK